MHRRGTFTTYQVIPTGHHRNWTSARSRSYDPSSGSYLGGPRRGPAPRLGPQPHLDTGQVPPKHLKWITLTQTCDLSKGASPFGGEREHFTVETAHAFAWTVTHGPQTNVERSEVLELVDDNGSIVANPIQTYVNEACIPKTAIKDTTVPTITREREPSVLLVAGLAAVALLALD